MGRVWALGQFAATLSRGQDTAMGAQGPWSRVASMTLGVLGRPVYPTLGGPACHSQWVAFLFLWRICRGVVDVGPTGFSRGCWGHGEEFGLQAWLPGSQPHHFLLRVALGKRLSALSLSFPKCKRDLWAYPTSQGCCRD